MQDPYGLTVTHKTNNKFGAKKTFYNGVWYDSKAEAVFARRLDYLRLAHPIDERVITVERQLRFPFILKGKKIFDYILDFKVFYANNTYKYFDVKGYKKGVAYSLFTIKKRCIESQYDIEIEEA